MSLRRHFNIGWLYQIVYTMVHKYYLTGDEVCKTLSISKDQLHLYKKHGLLHPTKQGKKDTYYIKEVEKLAERIFATDLSTEERVMNFKKEK